MIQAKVTVKNILMKMLKRFQDNKKSIIFAAPKR